MELPLASRAGKFELAVSPTLELDNKWGPPVLLNATGEDIAQRRLRVAPDLSEATLAKALLDHPRRIGFREVECILGCSPAPKEANQSTDRGKHFAGGLQRATG